MLNRARRRIASPYLWRLGATLVFASALWSACAPSPEASTDQPESLAFVRDSAAYVLNLSDRTVNELVESAVVGPVEWSSNGQLYAFSDGTDIWVARSGEAPERQTQLAGESASSIAWSSNGLAIAFAFGGSGDGVGVLDRTNGSLSRFPGYGSDYAWWEAAGLPASMLVIREQKTGLVYAVDPSAKTRRFLFRADAVAASSIDERIVQVNSSTVSLWSPRSGSRDLLSGQVESIGRVRWSRDGARVAIETVAATPPGTWILSLDGDEPALFITASQVSWGPAGDVLYASRDGMISKINLTTRAEEVLVPGEYPEFRPLSPVESQIRTVRPADRENLLEGRTSFEESLEGWITTGIGKLEAFRTTEDSFYGGAAALVQFGPEASFFAVNLVELKSELSGERLTFSAWLKTSHPGLHLSYFATHSSLLDGSERSGEHPGDGEWHRLSLSFTPEYDVGDITGFIALGIRHVGEGEALIDGVQLERGYGSTRFISDRDDPLSAVGRAQPLK